MPSPPRLKLLDFIAPKPTLPSVAMYQVHLLEPPQVRRPKWVLQLLSALLAHVAELLVDAQVRARAATRELVEEAASEESLSSPKACVFELNKENNFKK